MKTTSAAYRISVLILFAGLSLITGCATPVNPTGGEGDKTPPVLEEISPADGTTNFTGRKITFAFSEFVNRPSFQTALQVEPDIGLEYDIKWKRKNAQVVFKDDLPEETTIILSLGTELSDANRNKIVKPIQLAISTGDEIDSGEITGKVLSSETGKGSAGETVLLYKKPFLFTEKGDYSTETDTSGRFTFRYLSEGEYTAIYLEDRNRNKIWDTQSENAQPFPKESVILQKAGSDTLGNVFTVRVDSTAPRLLGVGLLSSRRMRLRFSESIGISDSSYLEIEDSLSGARIPADILYRDPEDTFVLFAHSTVDLSPDSTYSLLNRNIQDAGGNEAQTSEVYFNGSTQADTTLQRIIGREGEEGLFPDQAVKVVYAAPISDSLIVDSTTVIIGESANEAYPGLSTDRNRLIFEPQEGSWTQGVNYQFLAWNPVSQRRLLIDPEIWFPADYGEIEILYPAGDSPEFNYILQSQNGGIAEKGNFTGQITLNDIAPVNYKLIVYQDLNGNGLWDFGKVAPYEKPEPYFIRNPLRVTSGFTSQVNLQFE